MDSVHCNSGQVCNFVLPEQFFCAQCSCSVILLMKFHYFKSHFLWFKGVNTTLDKVKRFLNLVSFMVLS